MSEAKAASTSEASSSEGVAARVKALLGEDDRGLNSKEGLKKYCALIVDVDSRPPIKQSDTAAVVRALRKITSEGLRGRLIASKAFSVLGMWLHRYRMDKNTAYPIVDFFSAAAEAPPANISRDTKIMRQICEVVSDLDRDSDPWIAKSVQNTFMAFKRLINARIEQRAEQKPFKQRLEWMLAPDGGLRNAFVVQSVIWIMREYCEESAPKNRLQVLHALNKTNPTHLTRFARLGGLDTLSDWVRDAIGRIEAGVNYGEDQRVLSYVQSILRPIQRVADPQQDRIHLSAERIKAMIRGDDNLKQYHTALAENAENSGEDATEDADVVLLGARTDYDIARERMLSAFALDDIVDMTDLPSEVEDDVGPRPAAETRKDSTNPPKKPRPAAETRKDSTNPPKKTRSKSVHRRFSAQEMDLSFLTDLPIRTGPPKPRKTLPHARAPAAPGVLHKPFTPAPTVPKQPVRSNSQKKTASSSTKAPEQFQRSASGPARIGVTKAPLSRKSKPKQPPATAKSHPIKLNRKRPRPVAAQRSKNSVRQTLLNGATKSQPQAKHAQLKMKSKPREKPREPSPPSNVASDETVSESSSEESMEEVPLPTIPSQGSASGPSSANPVDIEPAVGKVIFERFVGYGKKMWKGIITKQLKEKKRWEVFFEGDDESRIWSHSRVVGVMKKYGNLATRDQRRANLAASSLHKLPLQDSKATKRPGTAPEIVKPRTKSDKKKRTEAQARVRARAQDAKAIKNAKDKAEAHGKTDGGARNGKSQNVKNRNVPVQELKLELTRVLKTNDWLQMTMLQMRHKLEAALKVPRDSLRARKSEIERLAIEIAEDMSPQVAGDGASHADEPPSKRARTAKKTKSWIGRTVIREFLQGQFEATIIKKVSNRQTTSKMDLWKVRFDDGYEEQLTKAEILEGFHAKVPLKANGHPWIGKSILRVADSNAVRKGSVTHWRPASADGVVGARFRVEYSKNVFELLGESLARKSIEEVQLKTSARVRARYQGRWWAGKLVKINRKRKRPYGVKLDKDKKNKQMLWVTRDDIGLENTRGVL